MVGSQLFSRGPYGQRAPSPVTSTTACSPSRRSLWLQAHYWCGTRSSKIMGVEPGADSSVGKSGVNSVASVGGRYPHKPRSYLASAYSAGVLYRLARPETQATQEVRRYSTRFRRNGGSWTTLVRLGRHSLEDAVRASRLVFGREPLSFVRVGVCRGASNARSAGLPLPSAAERPKRRARATPRERRSKHSSASLREIAWCRLTRGTHGRIAAQKHHLQWATTAEASEVLPSSEHPGRAGHRRRVQPARRCSQRPMTLDGKNQPGESSRQPH
ncbi:hypothetical protein AS850_03560 [Frondihabitans sp. 762G35]|nr:hypothetical protein AS850_03560 [Frondihabitans sp. 762G35]